MATEVMPRVNKAIGAAADPRRTAVAAG
jgi:hypothetical protein